MLIIDFKDLINSTIKLNEEKLSGYKLNNILQYFKIHNKIDINYN